MPLQNDHSVQIDSTHVGIASELPPRFPIRWRWTMLVGFAVMLAVLVLSLVILDMEREAWLKNQETQAEVLVDRLADELKIPMLVGSSAEIELIIKGKEGFLTKVPDVLGVHIQYANGKDQHFGDIGLDDPLLNQLVESTHIVRLPTDRLWYVKKVEYAGTVVGAVGVRYPEQAWEDLAGKLVGRMAIAAIRVVLMSSVMV